MTGGPQRETEKKNRDGRMEGKTHVFIVMVQHFTKLLPRNVCVVEDLVVRALPIEILMYPAAYVSAK